VVHGDAAARQAPLAPPVGAEAGHPLGVRVAEGLQRHEMDLADAPAVQDRAHRLDDRRVAVVVTGVNDALGAGGAAQHGARLVDRRRERLLAQHVQAAIEAGERHRGVVGGRRGHVDEVEPPPLAVEERLIVVVDPRLGPVGAGGSPPLFGDVGDGDDVDVSALPIPRGVPLLHDEPVADDGAPELVHG